MPIPASFFPGLKRLTRLPLFWQLQIAGWTLIAIATLPLKFVAFGSLTSACWVTLYREPFGLLLSAGLRWAYRRLKLSPARPIHLTVGVIVCSVLAGLVDASVGVTLHRLLELNDYPKLFLGVFSFRGALFIAWSLLYFWIKALLAARHHELTLERAETSRREAELQLLRAQVNPHFLFNALNTILATLEPGQTAPRRVVEGLAGYLRYSLSHRHDELVPLGAEFDAAVSYLAVEQARFRDELLAECNLDDAARAVLVPGVLLQPLIENAVKYSRQTSEPPYHVHLRVAAPSLAAVDIEVANTGDWVEPSAAPGPHGTGLANLRRRLALLYPRRHRLETSAAGGWVVVRLRLELKPRNPDAELSQPAAQAASGV